MLKLNEWPKNKKIVAIDFDGTITIADYRIWHNNVYTNDIHIENTTVTNWVRNHRDNMYLILWTCRIGKALDDAIDFCNSINIHFDAINDNIVCFESSNKIMADIYIDDKSVSINNLNEVIL